ncbi:MAG: nucleoside hydrolase [Nitrososphaerales archaeon]
MKVILDMDPGIDDAVALLIALNSAALDILGVTTVNGNVNVDKATYNALRIVDFMGKKITVAKGACKPLLRKPIHSEHIHGRDGLGDANLRTESKCLIDAQTFFHDMLTTHKKREISILATGPLTNIALLLSREPLAHRLHKIVFMGGVYNIVRNVLGNVSPCAEFNVYCDPEAADLVFNSNVQIDAVGLDVTTCTECAIDSKVLAMIEKIRGKNALIASELLRFPVSRYKIFHIHDVYALAGLLHPTMFKTINCNVIVDKSGKFRGRCIILRRKGNVNVCLRVSPKRFIKFVLSGLRQR